MRDRDGKKKGRAGGGEQVRGGARDNRGKQRPPANQNAQGDKCRGGEAPAKTRTGPEKMGSEKVKINRGPFLGKNTRGASM